MRFVLQPEMLQAVEKEGYGGFTISGKRGYSLDLCNAEKDICVNIGSARTFGVGYKKFCVNVSRTNYPYQPSPPICFGTRAEALSYAVALIDAINKHNTRYVGDEGVAEAMRDLVESGKACFCRSEVDPYPVELAALKALGVDEERCRKVCDPLIFGRLK